CWEQLEDVVRSNRHDWIRMRAFRELARWPELPVGASISGLLEIMPQSTRFVYEDILARTPATRDKPDPPHQDYVPPAEVRRFSYGQAQAFMNATGSAGDAAILLEVSKEEFLTLLSDLEPRFDTRWELRRSRAPAVSLGAKDWRVTTAVMV